MKIAIAQIKPISGDISKNIQLHEQCIEKVISKGADAIFFSELSITGYEPNLAQELQVDLNDERFNVFQTISNTKNITIGIGIPLSTKIGPRISMLIFQSNKARVEYSKQILHADELPYFKSGDKQLLIDLNGTKVAPAICYESLQTQHLSHAIQNGAQLYLASVAKPQKGIDKAKQYFPVASKTHNIPILMSNPIGFCDNFECAGQSGVWSENGQLLGALNPDQQGYFIYDLDNATIEKYYF